MARKLDAFHGTFMTWNPSLLYVRTFHMPIKQFLIGHELNSIRFRVHLFSVL